jgi:multimeric flavodoxin WrbA
MRILACVGSYRKNGNTAQVVGAIKEHLHTVAARNNEPLDIETLHLGHQDIRPCRGCRVCFDKGEEKCPFKDDLLPIRAKMQSADGLIVASPVYVNDVSGIVKNWIDRLAFVCHRPEFVGKSAFLISTVGLGPTSHALQTLRVALSSWGYHVVDQAGFKMGALMKHSEAEKLFDERTRKIAEKFFRAIQTRKFDYPSFISLMTFKIQQADHQQSDPASIDHQYWKSQGWIQTNTSYYVPHKADHLKVALARSFGAFFSRFVM